uniref:receptor protein-tyrosine kinase n=1 Tax=Panagrellus redivivus TaxID=6233 RepID=A0A7E4ZWZ7_PANRE
MHCIFCSSFGIHSVYQCDPYFDCEYCSGFVCFIVSFHMRVIDVVLIGLGLDQFSSGHFALRLAEPRALPGTSACEVHWLHPALRMGQVTRRYLRRPQRSVLPFRYELRIRFIPKDMREMYQTEMSAFLYFYEQLTGDYIDHVAWKIDADTALECGALMLRKRFPALTPANVEKKFNFKAIEQEGGLLRYLPEAMVVSTKKKTLQKQIIASVKKVAVLSELECVFQFIHIMMKIVKFDAEVFRASIGHGWTQPVELYIGDKCGIACKTENSNALTQLAKLRNVVDICVRRIDGTSDKGLVRLRISAQTAPLMITVPTVSLGESMAHLINGYQAMYRHQGDVWSVQDLLNTNHRHTSRTRRAQTLSPQVQRHQALIQQQAATRSVPFARAVPISTRHHHSHHGPRRQRNTSSSNSDDYAKSMTPMGVPNTFLERNSVQLEELIGDGLFGIVYRGSYTDRRTHRRMPVAVKVCKDDGETGDLELANKFLLEEAYTMQQFRHPHVIRLMGICTGPHPGKADDSSSDDSRHSPKHPNNNNNNVMHPLAASVWIVMELAPLGELRTYLQRERAIINLEVQLLFAKQIASATAYLHSNGFVHRDIAARNCLVTSPRCLKLSDFGMSKMLAEEEVYTSSSGKLPIKWMAPESLNYRRFTAQSDVYSLGVCIWEILMHGIKPWQGIRNHEVIKKIEAGETLARPPDCPLALYDMLRAMWVIDENFRMTAAEAMHFLEHLLDELLSGKPAAELTVPDFHMIRQKISALHPPRRQPDHRRQSIPDVLNVDASQVPTSTLWRAMESQRQQCEEDEKWLEGETGDTCPSPISSSTPVPPPVTTSKSNPSPKPKPRPQKSIELDRASDSVHEAVLRVVQAVTHLTKTYSINMSNDDFVAEIKVITNELSTLFADSVKDIQKMAPEDRKRVEMVEGLLGTDLKNMTTAMAHVVKEGGSEKTKCDFHRREVLKTAHMLAVNCKHFLDSVDEARLRSGIARLRTRSPPPTIHMV